ncbi:MAG: PRD domain-containing protein [Clostridiales bacterium]|nr:PRD domain-containing protein [Clostridiales bacterium]
MVIEKVINNNIISAYDESGREVVVMGQGLGYGMKAGRIIEEEKIEKVFHIKSASIAEQFKELLRNMPLEHVQISNDVISYAKKDLKLKLNQSIYVTLTDHINFAIERCSHKVFQENALLWAIKRFYNQEYLLGKYAISLIKERLQIDLPEDEAGFIALHFVNAEYGTAFKDILKCPNLLRDVLDIVKAEMKSEINEESLHFERFVTHVKFLLQRIYRNELLSEENKELEDILCGKYPKACMCSQKIVTYIENETKVRIPREELLYLTIHIHRIAMKEE